MFVFCYLASSFGPSLLCWHISSYGFILTAPTCSKNYLTFHLKQRKINKSKIKHKRETFLYNGLSQKQVYTYKKKLCSGLAPACAESVQSTVMSFSHTHSTSIPVPLSWITSVWLLWLISRFLKNVSHFKLL